MGGGGGEMITLFAHCGYQRGERVSILVEGSMLNLDELP